MAKAKNSSRSSLKRIMKEIVELQEESCKPDRMFVAKPLESDLYEWHFSIRGPPETPFEGGVYHGRILLPLEYPFKAPEIIFLTENGRFECNARICLSITSFHQETWQPSWGIRTILTALIGFLPSDADGHGAMNYPDEDRRRLAKTSRQFKCPSCGTHPYSDLNAPVRVRNEEEPGSSNDEVSMSSTDEEKESGRAQAAEGSSAPAAGRRDVADAGPRADTGAVTMSASVPAAVSASVPAAVGADQPEQAARVPPLATSEAVQTPQPPAPVVPPAAPPAALAAAGQPATQAPALRPGTPTEVEGNHTEAGREKELLYLAYALLIAIVAIMARRAFIFISVAPI